MNAKNFFLVILIGFFVSSFSQELYKLNYKYTDINGVSFDSALFINNNEAVYKIYDNRNRGLTDSSNESVFFVENDELSKFFYANDQVAYARFINYDEEIIYQDDYKSKLNWRINTDKQKKIGNYNCTEAKVRINQRSFTVWFTSEIPLKFGPLKLHGLPGAIVEVFEDSGFLKLELNTISKIKDRKEFDFYKKYFFGKKKILTYTEFEKRIIEDEVAARMRVYAYYKELDLTSSSKTTHSIDESMFADDYLEYPYNLLSELRKVK